MFMEQLLKTMRGVLRTAITVKNKSWIRLASF